MIWIPISAMVLFFGAIAFMIYEIEKNSRD